ncbi:hypothetical protein ADK57_34895 [Streptomyces sp. MMG1533]|uniref:hypothetical protein n=1 Tax=Streptomyces sp. MMG1533 TaxID=1415546 RepID=UPI0006BEDFE2|nr:hypothetical protein [Streptomyces sp. MMG1533]KOU58900.1 hypothetical protein ADK57_34895 [Streptomyces sp. MMG1533]
MTPTEPRADVKPKPDVSPPDPTSTEPTSAQSRADRFVRDLAALKIPDPAAARAGLWLRLGGTLMVLGLVLALSAYLVSHNTQNPLDQRDGLALGLGGIAASVVGGALFLRYSLTGFLRFWMARQSYDLAVLADRLCAASSERDPHHDRTSTDAAPR